MASLADISVSSGDLRFESRREHEFYRYYEPIRELTANGPPLCDLSDAQSVSRHRPASSPDRALTAFCQLGALRLGTRRAMLFFFDSKYGYILAEATRTLSLQDDSIYEPEDTLWMGHAIIPRGGSVCEHTVLLPHNEGSNSHDQNAGLVHVVNDLAEDTRFCDRSFVTSGPRARFYAGVPITTPRGINIGAYCVLDDKVRPGLNQKETDFLRDMAATVMTHLDMVRAKAELKRSGHMVTSLGAFVGDTPRSRGSPEAHREPTASTDAVQTKPANASQGVSSVDQIFEQAAGLVEKAVDTDGVLFVDATVSGPANFAETLDASSGAERGTDTSASGTDVTDEYATDTSDHATAAPTDTKPPLKTCRILGSSNNDLHSAHGSKAQIPEAFVQSLLRRYRRGKVWNFNESGFNPSDDETAMSTTTSKPTCACQPDQKSDTINHVSDCSKSHRKSRQSDSQKIQRLFPGVRSFGFVGMWDHSRRRWQAACIFWTYRPLRVFSEYVDSLFVSAFCDVMLAKIHRLEAQISERAKSDFISTISHELRSPLHGILGSVECLQEDQSMDSFSSEMVTQIDVCGRTLIDIIDHLLDYSKINYLTKRRLNTLPNLKSKKHHGATRKQAPDPSIAFDIDIPLAQVTEEVIETAVYAFCHSRDPGTMLKHDVAVIFDIDILTIADLKFEVAVGAWKRMCINLVSNALKYTARGHIKISLEVTRSERKARRAIVKFTVADTGKGMTKEYLENDLFRAFSQENSLVEGAGLGMNLVAKIVKAFNGKIDVQSTENFGTTCTVTMPLHYTKSEQEDEAAVAVQRLPSPAVGISVAIVEPESLQSASEEGQHSATRSILLTSIRKTLTTIGARTVSFSEANADQFDICLCHEDDLRTSSEQDDGLNVHCLDNIPVNKPVIVLCDNAVVTRRLRAGSLGKNRSGHIELVAQPAGPERLLKAIRACREALAMGLNSEQKSSVKKGAEVSRSPPKEINGIANDGHALLTDLLGKNGVSVGEGVERLDFSQSDTIPLKASGHDGDATAPYLKLAVRDGAVQPVSLAKDNGQGKDTLSLLLVDDNPINLRLLESYATKNKHHRLTAINGQIAVDAYKAASAATASTPRPQIILMDINMPVLDGFGATRAIRSFEKQHAIPPAVIIALTGLGSTSAQQEAFDAGVDLFLTKPVRFQELTKILDGIRSA